MIKKKAVTEKLKRVGIKKLKFMNCDCVIEWLTFLLTLVGFYFTYIQIKRSVKEKSISNFIEIKNQLRVYDSIYFQLLPGSDEDISNFENGYIFSYLGLFEIVNKMIKNKLLSKEEYKTFFQYRVILIFRNQYLRDIITQNEYDWKDLIELNSIK